MIGATPSFAWLFFSLLLPLAAGAEEPSPNTTSPVTLTVWTTPNGDWNCELLSSVKEIVARLVQEDHILSFEPNQYVHDGSHACRPNGFLDGSRRERCEKNCLYEGRYCHMPREGDDEPPFRDLEGSAIVAESARRQCVWQMANELGQPMLFFEYLEALQDTNCFAELTAECLEGVLKQVGFDATQVEDCIYFGTNPSEDTENFLLQQQLDRAVDFVTDIPLVTVDGPMGDGTALESAGLNTKVIFRAVCEAYLEGAAPSLCGTCKDCPAVEACLQDSACPPESLSAGFQFFEGATIESFSDSDDDDGEIYPEDFNESDFNSMGRLVDDDDDGDNATPTPGPTHAPTDPEDPAEFFSDLARHDVNALLRESNFTIPTDVEATEKRDNSISDTVPKHHTDSGFAKVAHLLAKKDIFVYQMFQNCGVDFRHKGPLVSAIEQGDQASFASGADVCGAQESNQFTKASANFEQCAGFDFLEFAETNAGTLGKSFFGCLNTFATVPDNHISLEQCTALVLNTGLWRPVGYFLEYNKMVCPCIPGLHTNLPDCMFQRGESTTVLDGPAVKLSACLMREVCNTIDPMCETEVNVLNECLPHLDEDLPCGEIEKRCKRKGALLFTSPFPVAGASFPDRCQSAARKVDGLSNPHIVSRYTSYRRKCVLKEEVVREFGSPDEPKGIVVEEEESFSSALEAEAERSFRDVWNDQPVRTRILAGGVGYLTIALLVALLYAYKRRKRSIYKTAIRMQTRTFAEEVRLADQQAYRDDDSSKPPQAYAKAPQLSRDRDSNDSDYFENPLFPPDLSNLPNEQPIPLLDLASSLATTQV